MKKNRFKKNYRIATAAYAFVLVVALIVSSASGLPENSSLSAVMTGNIAAPQVSAAQAMLTDENGKVLYEKTAVREHILQAPPKYSPVLRPLI